MTNSTGKIRIGINGFGRIGRNVFRSAIQSFSDIEVVAINDLLEPEYLAYMLQYDSVHGRFKGDVSVEGNTLIINGKKIRLTQERDPLALKWSEVGADVVLEATGLFLDKASGEKHLAAGIGAVVHAEDEHRGVVLRRGREDDLFGAGSQMLFT